MESSTLTRRPRHEVKSRPNAAVQPPRVLLAEVEVRRVARVSPGFVRVEFGGRSLDDLHVEGPWVDQRIKLIFPSAQGQLPQLPQDDTWYVQWKAMPTGRRGFMRTYTVRDVDPAGEATRLVVDIAVHEPDQTSGPGNAWALGAAVGDRILVVVPRRGVDFGGREFRAVPGSQLLLIGDETAVPAIAGILRDLSRDTVGLALLEVASSADKQQLNAPPGMRICWLPRNSSPRSEQVLAELATHPPVLGGVDHTTEHQPCYAWVAGELSGVGAVRRMLSDTLAIDPNRVTFMGYWREGTAVRS